MLWGPSHPAQESPGRSPGSSSLVRASWKGGEAVQEVKSLPPEVGVLSSTAPGS